MVAMMMIWMVTSETVSVYAMKALMGSRGTPPLILNISTSAGEWSAGCPGHFTCGANDPGTQ